MDVVRKVPPEPSGNNSLWYGVGIATVGLIGGALAYSTMGSGQANLGHYKSAPKPPRLPRQTYNFDTTILNAVGKDEEDNFPILIILHQTPRGRQIPCIAPFALKLETFLRVHAIKYEVDFESKEPSNEESAWISLEHEDVIDAQNAMEYICDACDIDLDAHISDEDRAVSRAFHTMLQKHLYWGIMLDRYVYQKSETLRQIQFLSPQSQDELPKTRDAMAKAVWYNGIGKHDPLLVSYLMISDLEALSALLGKKDYFFGQIHPSEIDCTAFAILAQILWTMPDSPYCHTLQYRCKNLKDFCWRMRKTFWVDWETCLHNIPWDPKEAQIDY